MTTLPNVEHARDYMFELTDEKGVKRYECARFENGWLIQNRWRDESLEGNPSRISGGNVMLDVQRFVAEHVAQDHTQIFARKPRVLPERPATLKRGQLAPLAGIDEKLAKAAISKAKKAKDPYKIKDAIEAASSYDDQGVLFWHLVRNGHLDIGANVFLIEVAASYVDEATPAEVMDVLAKLPPLSALYKAAGVGASSFLPEHSHDHERLLWSAFRRDPDLVRSRAHELSPELQVALRCVRRRAGDTLTREEAQSVLDGFKKAKLHVEGGLSLKVIKSVAPPDARTAMTDLAPDELLTVSVKGLMNLFA